MGYLQIISAAWFVNLFVTFWIGTFWKYKSIATLKPFACQECLGFWGTFCVLIWYKDFTTTLTISCLVSMLSYLISRFKTSLNKL